MHTRFWSENLKGRGHSEDLGVDEMIIEWIRETEGGRCGLDSSGSG